MEYNSLYARSLANPQKFWGEMAVQELAWFKAPLAVHQQTGHKHAWFADGKLNITYNCLDRHVLNGGGEKTAYIWVNEVGDEQRITYAELLGKVNQTARFLLNLGLKKGDTLTIYMPMTPELITAMLACARVGIIHSVVFAGFSYQALESRIIDAGSRYLLTADYTYRKGKKIDLLSVARESVRGVPGFQKLIVFKREATTELQENELNLETEVTQNSDQLEAPEMGAEDKLFILYTSGTTGKPKGIVHTTAGYNLYTHLTTKYTFGMEETDIYWCSADCGWITGHSYVVYGPLSNHLTTLIYEGAPDFPNPERWWAIIEKYGVTVFYTSPTAIRMLMSYGEAPVKKHNLRSLRRLGSVGEPLNEAAWHWFHETVGAGKCPIADTWWQTETGGHLLTTFPGMKEKPGWAGLPYFGLRALIVGPTGQKMQNGEKGNLVIEGFWPSVLRRVWKDAKRYEEYWTKIPPYFFTGDIALKDKEGYVKILGRSDDIMVVAGHNISSAELEAVIASHEKVVEAAVVGVPDAIRGNEIVAHVVLLQTVEGTGAVEKELNAYVAKVYGKHGRAKKIVFTPKLPKTRSGKIMRRVLRARERQEDLGDTSTLEE